MRAAPHLVLILAFLAIIGGTPIVQALHEKLAEHESPTVLNLFSRRPSEVNLRAFEKELDDSSKLGEKLRGAFQLGRWLSLRELGEKALLGVGRWMFFTPEVTYLAEAYTAAPIEAIVDFQRQLRARGIDLLVVPVPSKPSIYPDRLVTRLRPSLEAAANTQRLLRELGARGVAVLNLHQVFLDHRKQSPETLLFMERDTHWSGHGVHLAALTIAARVRTSAWYRAPSGLPRYRRDWVSVERKGDIPRMTRIPRWEKLFPTETVGCYQVRSLKDGSLYEDDPTSPILLLGDSYARVFQTDEPEAAGLIANLAFELQLPLSSIANDGGASTLVRQELARDLSQLQGKRLVIWIFAERDARFGLQGWQKIQL
jgi:hypothetical protein